MADASEPVENGELDKAGCPLLRETLNRKKIELDARAQTNRINLLEHEEAKVLTKISLTREKACSLMDIKRFKRGHQSTLDEWFSGIGSAIEKRHVDAKEMKNYLEEAVAENRKEYFENTTDQANEVKEQLGSLKERYHAEKRQTLMENMQSVKDIRGFEEQVIKEKEDQLNMVMQASRSRYENQIQDEVDRRDYLTNKMAALENREQELIKKLKNTQNIHAQALEDMNRIQHNQEPISVLSEVHTSNANMRKPVQNTVSARANESRAHDRTGVMTRPGANAYKR